MWAELSLDPANVRKHDRRNLDAIKASLRKFGQQKPIVVDTKGIVLAGNGTLTAAKELGWSEIEDHANYAARSRRRQRLRLPIIEARSWRSGRINSQTFWLH